MSTEASPQAGTAPAPTAAEALGFTPAPAAQSGEPRSHMAQQIQDALHPREHVEENLPEALRELRNDPERRMIPADKIYASAEMHRLFEGSPTAATDTRAWQEIAADFGLPPERAREFVGLVEDARKRAPDDATVERWSSEAMQHVRLTYGHRADDMLADAKRLVARDPRVSKLLNESGLGSHPRVVRLFVERAASLKALGRLK